MRRDGFSPSVASWASLPMWNSPPEISAILVQLARSAEVESKRLKHQAKERQIEMNWMSAAILHVVCSFPVHSHRYLFPVSKLPHVIIVHTCYSAAPALLLSLPVRLHGSWLTLWLRSVPSAAVHPKRPRSLVLAAIWRKASQSVDNPMAEYNYWCRLDGLAGRSMRFASPFEYCQSREIEKVLEKEPYFGQREKHFNYRQALTGSPSSRYVLGNMTPDGWHISEVWAKYTPPNDWKKQLCWNLSSGFTYRLPEQFQGAQQEFG